MYSLASKLVHSASKRQLYSRVIGSRNYMAKDINFGIAARAAMLQGVNEVAEAVKVTMGLKGRNVTIEKSISFKGKPKNVGADPVKQVANATAAGDGMTCATVLTQAILTEGCKTVAAGVNVMNLCSGINMAVDAVISDLKKGAAMISTPEEMTQVATISANGECEIGEMLATAVEKVGAIPIADGKTLENELEVVEGMKLARGYVSPYFITDQKTQKWKNRPLLVAEDVESEALSMLILNKHHAGLKVCAIKAPGCGNNRRSNLDDLAVFTGGEVISEERGLSLNKVQLEMLGSAKMVTISLDDAIILHGAGDKKQIEEICEQVCWLLMISRSPYSQSQAFLQDRPRHLENKKEISNQNNPEEYFRAMDLCTYITPWNRPWHLENLNTHCAVCWDCVLNDTPMFLSGFLVKPRSSQDRGSKTQSAGNQRHKSTLVGTSETTCATNFSISFCEWLAGIIDGNGSMKVSKQGYTSLEIIMGLEDLRLLRYIQNMLGGGIKMRSGAKAYRYKLHHKPGMIKLIHCINGHIRHSARLLQLHRICQVLDIPVIVPITLDAKSNWFAGFFDADGIIDIAMKDQLPQLSIAVTNKLLQDVEPYRVVFGGAIYFDSGRNGYYQWSVQSRKDVVMMLDYFNASTFRSHKSRRFFLIKKYYSLYDLKAFQPDSIHHKAWLAFLDKWNIG